VRILYQQKPKRIFTFGCSFTQFWQWATWANILAYDLDIPFYNLGRGGAGNTYIANRITQADNIYNFTEDDLVLVCWSTYAREDRWTDQGWVGYGNVHTDDLYPREFVVNYCSDEHFFIRDMSLMTLVDGYLTGKKVNYHMFSIDRLIPYGLENFLKGQQKVFGKILPSYADIIYGGDLRNANTPEDTDLTSAQIDNHPTILQHLTYLEKVFDNPINQTTRDHVVNTYNKWKEWVLAGNVVDREEDVLSEFYIQQSEEISGEMV